MNIYLKYVFTLFLRFILKLFYIFPIKNNRVIFLSFEGSQYSDSPKYIYEALIKEKKDIQYIWVLNNKDNAPNQNIKIVGYRKFKFFYYMLTSKVIINNQFTITYIPFRKTQTVIGTWHGGGAYKKCQLDVVDTKYDRKYTKIVSKNIGYAVSSCQSFSNAFNSAYLIDMDKFITYGMPRNDMLINSDFLTDLEKQNIFTKIQDRYNIDTDDKLVLYAPTFRSSDNMPISSFVSGNFNLDTHRLKQNLSKRFGGNWQVLYRAHPKLKGIALSPDAIDVSNYPDMQELLFVCDVLINDYSSSMWDFSFTGRPIFIYAEDLQDYIGSRDFYTPIDQWPYPLSQNNQQLEESILNFDNVQYQKNVAIHHKQLGSYETGKATQYLKELTLKKLIFD